MQTALAITLAFVAATSGMGAMRSAKNALAFGQRSDYAGALVALVMTVWCGFLAVWVVL